MVEVLSAFPARPPTPPRTTNAFIDGPISSSDSRYGLLGTPGDSPPSTNETITLSTSSRSKRVNFSPWTKYIKPPSFSSQTTGTKNELRDLPRSNDCKPSKSILKITTMSPLPSPSQEEGDTAMSFGFLLESVTRQLAGESLSSRLDAYVHLLGSLKTYEGVPEEQAMISNLGQVTQFIQRDISRNIGDGDPQGVNLITSALKLTIFFAWSPNLASQLPEDFRAFIVDYSLQALQEAKAPKSLLTHYMHLLSTQNFTVKTMTIPRIGRVLSVLKDITKVVNGNGIVAQRLSIYQRLLTQSKTTMAAQANLWVENFISGLLHQIKDTRSRAISFGMQLSAALGPNLMISNTIQAVFDKPLDKGRRLVSEICERMVRMMSNPETGVHVPQVWSIIVLLLRSKKFVIVEWEHFKEWVLVLQKCFNCSESLIKAQAILAWNRFVYAVEPNESTGLTMIRMLGKPILSQFERRKHENSNPAITQLSLSSYYNLLYYALRPESSFHHLDVVWAEYIAQPFNQTFATSEFLNDHACRLLRFLLWGSSVKVWNENKVNETSKLKPEDVPPLDSRWVRSRVNTILKVFETPLKNATWNTLSVEKSEIAAAWASLCKAVSAASEKEITPSTDLMQAIAAVLGMLQRLWNTGASSMDIESDDYLDDFLSRFSFIATTAIISIGPMPFTEKLLQKTAQETFQMAGTPTHRRPGTDINLDTPFMHLLRLVTTGLKLKAPTASFKQLVSSLIDAGLRGRTSRGSRLDFLEKYSDLLPYDFNENLLLHRTFAHLGFVQSTWEVIAQLSEECLRSFPLESAREREGRFNRDYDNVLKILQRGLAYPEANVTWSKLLEALIGVVRTERGDIAIANVIIEPIAERVLELDETYARSPVAIIIDNLRSLPGYQCNNSHSKLDQVQQTFAPACHGDTRFPEKVMHLIKKVLYDNYHTISTEGDRGVTAVIEALTSLLGLGVLNFRSTLLGHLQEMLSTWLEDKSRYLTPESCGDCQVLVAHRSLSLAVVNILQSDISHDSVNLSKFGLIISAGLGSQHMSIANLFIEMWNSTFGLQESLEYPESVLMAVKKLEPHVELFLPSLSLCQVRQVPQESFRICNSQRFNMDASENSHLDLNSAAYSRILKPRTLSSSPIAGSHDVSPAPAPGSPPRQTPKRCLRHEDSQVEFIPVESSLAGQTLLESQNLTARQKEVKERQCNETAKFLDGLRSSSPVLPSPTEGVSVSRPIQLTPLDAPEAVHEIPLTPTLPMMLAENDDAFPGSSPTPTAKGRRPLGETAEAPSLSIQALEALTEPEIPSSPPEIEPQGPKYRKSMRRKSSGPNPRHRGQVDNAAKSAAHSIESEREPQTSEAIAGDSTVDADYNEACCGPTSDFDTSGAMICEEICPELVERSESIQDKLPEQSLHGDGDLTTDELDMQVASQLEQDLELAVDLDEIQETQSQSEPPASLPITRKRKREQMKEPSSTPLEWKRRSLRSSAVGARQVGRVKSEELAQEKKGISSPSSPAKGPRKQKIHGTKDFMEKATSKRKSDVVEDSGAEKSPVFTADSSLNKRRRSSRLSGLPTVPVEEENVIQIPRRKTRSQAKDLSMAGSQIAKEWHRKSDQTLSASIEKLDASDTSAKAQEGSEPHSIHEPMDSVNASVEKGESDVLDGDSARALCETAHPQYLPEPVETTDMTTTNIVIDHEPTGNGILASLRHVLGGLKRVAFGRETLREMDNLIFDIRFEAQEAVRRQEN